MRVETTPVIGPANVPGGEFATGSDAVAVQSVDRKASQIYPGRYVLLEIPDGSPKRGGFRNS